jgi:hypothetical protein
VIEKLVEQVEDRFAELERQMSDPEVIAERERYADVGRAYRDVCAMIAPLPPAPSPRPPAAAPAPPAPPPPPPPEPRAAIAFASETPDIDDPRAELRVEELTRILQADPSRDDIVDELAALLIRLGRGLELLALLSARLEDAAPARRAQLLPTQRAVLERLEQDARASGRAVEADLFRDTRLSLAD